MTLRPPTRPMRPTSPTQPAPSQVVRPDPKPAVVAAPEHDWRALAMELLEVVERRPRLGKDLEAVVNRIREAAGMTPRPAACVVQDATPAPASNEMTTAPEGAVRCVDGTYYNAAGEELYPDGGIVPDFLRSDFVPSKPPSSPSSPARDPDAEDEWLDPFADARREAADPDHGAKNAARLEAERTRIEALKKSLRPRPPMRKS